MIKKITEICKILKKTNRDKYYFKNISNSVITIINRTNFDVTDNWFMDLLAISYDEEIKNKYIPELHESNEFERHNLIDILDFKQWLGYHTNQLRICEDYINRFKNSYRDFYQIIDSEKISIINNKHPFLEQVNNLFENLSKIETALSSLKTYLETEDYDVLFVKNQLNNVCNPIKHPINFRQDDWSDFLDNKPKTFHVLHYIFQHHNQVYYELNSLNAMLTSLKTISSHKIIVGNAGTGKTHVSAHLINKIKENGDYVLFFKSKQFNGDNINFNDRLLQLLQLPSGYTLNEILEKINRFVLAQNKRCFFIIDALNETTKSSIGFSNIWRDNLQDFMNQINLFSHLYLVCTLRTSYIDQIWHSQTPELSEIKGFDKPKDVQALCKRYFKYYRINVSNFNLADLTIFRVPLLLDLYCKLINDSRVEEKNITLNMTTYLQIFEDYINNVSSEVQRKLNFQKKKLITDGFAKSSISFYQNNEAIISLDKFSDAFDADDAVTVDNSIARAVLDGYLIFIKDLISRNNEIVKHTQQEVGGYLLAKFLFDQFPNVEDLLKDKNFQAKILGTDSTKHHQLRLDILKFLIAMQPDLILELKSKEGLKLSWWYLYNGFSDKIRDDIPDYLLLSSAKDPNIKEILNISSSQWFNPDNKFNFHFIARVLEKLDPWSFDLSWTFFIYQEVDFFYKFIEDNTNRLNENKLEYNKVVAKFIAFSLATTIRELRDLATIYLIEFGKIHPLELLELTEYSSKLSDNYIYERLASCCYGLSLILQNNNDFVKNILPKFATRAYQLQFAENAIVPVYNYIVIDSFKHLINLAIYKEIISLNESIIGRLNNYQFPLPHEWIAPTKKQKTLIYQSHETSWQEPIRMDFGIYTIPRLIDDKHVNRRDAIANVYKRIFELGYQTIDSFESYSEQFKDFYYGHKFFHSKGKVDRLGKKYCWKGFFDYAGVLLLNNKLDIIDKYSKENNYKRLSDIDIDICLPSKEYKTAIRLYKQDLIINPLNNIEWYTEIKIDSITPLFEHSFNDSPYVLLHGIVEQRIDEEYKTRSYLLVETFLIRKNENLDKAKEACKITFSDWDLDNHFLPEKLYQTYFGELYWADNIGEYEDESVSIPTGNKTIIKRYIQIYDLFRDNGVSDKHIGEEIEEEVDERIPFQSAPTLVEYLWESNSEILKGYSEYYPSLKMGKSLSLKSDPLNGKILDSNLNECFQCIEFEKDFFENKFNYMRSDLLKAYMNDNNYALLYQIKQHSYDKDYKHNRSMKYFILE